MVTRFLVGTFKCKGLYCYKHSHCLGALSTCDPFSDLYSGQVLVLCYDFTNVFDTSLFGFKPLCKNVFIYL